MTKKWKCASVSPFDRCTRVTEQVMRPRATETARRLRRTRPDRATSPKPRGRTASRAA